MANTNLNYKIVPLFNSNKTPVTVAGTSESVYNTGYSTFTLEVAGTAVGRVEGCINIANADGSPKADNECSWTTLGIINMQSYAFSQGFTQGGKYAIGINGMARIRVVLTSVTGSVTLVGVMEE